MYAHARHLAARGHDVHVVTSRLTFPTGIDHSLPSFERLDNFNIWRCSVLLRSTPRYISYPSRGGLIIRGLTKILQNINPNIIHAHNIGAGAWAFSGARYARQKGAAFFYSPHFHYGKLRLDWLRKSLARSLNYIPLRSAEKIYHLTSSVYEQFVLDYPYAPIERFAVLSNGVDPASAPKTNRQQGEPLRILFVGRVDDKRKGFHILEQAISELPHTMHQSFVLTVVGAITNETRLRIEARHDQRIRILGPISEQELERAYADSDLFVMPSLYEGFGMPYVEAMRYGIPVIGSFAGGTPEIVPPAVGILTPPGDATAVSTALFNLITDDELRVRLGSAGREWARRFSWNAIIDNLEADYRSAHHRYTQARVVDEKSAVGSGPTGAYL